MSSCPRCDPFGVTAEQIHTRLRFLAIGDDDVARAVTLRQLIARADKALYAAKGAGRNQVCHG